jgi:acyl-[acyl-carrier-protein]-phospholipid O-acyltransferase/long-chain-fatty-acid--[acyl-carrier-protein] ligase
MAIGRFTDVLKRGGFPAFLGTQFLGALNDNIYKMAVSLVAVGIAVDSEGSRFLALAQGLFIVPFILFSGYAGYVADTYSKRAVLIGTKLFEVVAMVCAIAALSMGRIELLLGVLFLMATQSAFFGPAKYGILPEMFGDRDLTRANALLQMTTFVAIIIGTALGGVLFDVWDNKLWMVGVVLLGVALAGAASSFGITRVAPAGTPRPFLLNPFGEVAIGLKYLRSVRPLWLTVIAIAYFWFVGAMMQIAILLFGKQTLGVGDFEVSVLVVFFAVGIGVGSMAVGRLSGDKVEIGLVPLGAMGMGVFSLALSVAAPSYWLSAACLLVLGFSGGFYAVPLNAYLQQKADEKERGRLLAAAGFLTNVGVLLAAGASWFLSDQLGFGPAQVILTVGILSLLATVYILTVVPDFLIRFLLWLFTHTLYRIRIEGGQQVPFRGPALLVCNHVSLMDGLLVGACVQRFVRFLVYKPYFEKKAFNWILTLMRAIPVMAGDRRGAVESIRRARQELVDGHVVCIFAEGAVSRTGNLLPFKRGFERMIDGLDVPIIPVHLDRLWGSIFSFERGKFLWKRPRRIPYPVTVSFGAPMPSDAKAFQVRQAIAELGAEATANRLGRRDLLDRRFLRMAKRHWSSLCVADSTGKELTYGKTLIGALALSRWVRKRCAGQEMVGLLLPASVGAAMANIAVLLAGKVPVNLNFTAGPEAMDSAIEQCGIKTILSSRVFMKKAGLEEMPGVAYLERVAKDITPLQKGLAAICAAVLPARALEWVYTPGRRSSSSLATIIFSSGSTGTPKGVMLSHGNIISNLESVAQVYWVSEKDRMMGVLPFFHCFGFTITLWFPLLSGFPVIYHPNPLDAKTIGRLAEKYGATFLLSTPTFLATYARKCTPEQFASLRHVIVGAEKLRESLADQFREKFGLELLEGYGCTEMAPVVAVNSAGFSAKSDRQPGHKPGTVGHPLPSVAAKVLHLESGEPVGPNEEGLLLVKGPNCMQGYLGRPEKTKEVLKDGWYETGDVALIDDDGFIKITDRLSRFSKIGGEMVPHVKIEETVSELLGSESCAVTAVADERKGERIVVLYADEGMASADLWERLSRSSLPKLWIPKREDVVVVDQIPLLGSGKLDLSRLRSLAIELLAP